MSSYLNELCFTTPYEAVLVWNSKLTRNAFRSAGITKANEEPRFES